jgi:hypothetical protein
MIIRRNAFFGCLFTIVLVPFLFYKIYWITHSKRVNGVMGFIGKAYATDQIVHVYSVIKYPVGKDTFWFNGNDNIFFQRGELVPVRYRVNDPSDARIDIFSSIWGDTIVYGGIPLLILLISFIHPQIVPYRSRVLLHFKPPFLKVVD